MKLLPLLFVSFTTLAQNPKIDIKRFKEDASYRDALVNYFNQKDKPKVSNEVALLTPPVLVNPKPGVHSLPQDHMPCIIPDTKEIAAIPNAWNLPVKVPFIGNPPRIPNPTLPIIIQTDKLKRSTDSKG